MVIRSSLASRVYVSGGAGLLSAPTNAGTGCCGAAACAWDHTGLATKTTTANRISFGKISPMRERLNSWDNDGVPGLKSYVLGQVLSLNHVVVVERKSRLGAVRVLAKNVDGFLLCEIPKSSSNRDCI